MEIEHTPAKTREARTMYRLTEAEVICALDDYVRRHQISTPCGKRGVWSGWSADHRNDWWATLVVDHGEPKPAATAVRMWCRACGRQWQGRPDETDNFVCLTPIAQCCPKCGGLGEEA